MTLHAKDYGVAEALCGRSPIVVALDMAVAVHRESVPLLSPMAMRARENALYHYNKIRARMDVAQLRKTNHGK